MPIIKITKKQIEKAHEARTAALREDPEYRAFEEEQEKLTKEAVEQRERDEEAS